MWRTVGEAAVFVVQGVADQRVDHLVAEAEKLDALAVCGDGGIEAHEALVAAVLDQFRVVAQEGLPEDGLVDSLGCGRLEDRFPGLAGAPWRSRASPAGRRASPFPLSGWRCRGESSWSP